ncbi:MAG: Hsp20/alpha crystallin family protein [bacterium]|nr:Hsp20/alpha crystallin family protein [bacterium]
MLIPKRNFDFFDDLFNDPFFTSHESKLMKTDIKEHNDKYELLVDLPGFNKENIKIHIEDGYLIINAKTEIKDNDKQEKGKYVRKERYYGECSRSFYVGSQIKEEDIKANLKNGILNIEIPKENDTKQIEEKKYIEIGE